ncbi:MAG: hypothetical protein M0R51_04215 [Clostridia bacterium]|jgi:hypothetical protein|nr:hypothetical protein [Clostridia bacterium]
MENIEITQKIESLDEELLENQYHCREFVTGLLGEDDVISIQRFHGIIGGKNNFADCKNGQFLNFTDFWDAWLGGLYNYFKEISYRNKPIILKIIEDDYLRDYVKIFLERNYYKNYKARIRNKPLNELTEIWFGKNGSNLFGLWMAPERYGDKWINKERTIRMANFEYWTIGHILATGLITENPQDGKIIIKDLDSFIQFYRLNFLRNTNSQYEQAIIENYLEYVKISEKPLDIPFLIPEFRYNGKVREHLYRLDFVVLNVWTQRFVGFEISPASTHLSIQKSKEKTQKAINEELSLKWESEMDKRNKYFAKYNISLVTFTDNLLLNVDNCFNQIKDELNIKMIKKVGEIEHLKKLKLIHYN